MAVHAGESTILELGIAYLDELSPTLGPDIKMRLIHAMSTYLGQQSTFDQSQQIFFSYIGRAEPLEKLREIVEQPDDPINLQDQQGSGQIAAIEASGDDSGDDSAANRKRTRSWTQQEDIRLLAGIYRYGADNWTTISLFVGNGRTRAQCCQRWTRGLNPRISKNLWSYEEDLRLVQLVNTYGDKSWTRIAAMMGNRSDVQCRYHYHQVMRDMPPILKKMIKTSNMTSNVGSDNPNFTSHVDSNALAAAIEGRHATISPELQQIRTSIEAQLPTRYSLPQLTMPPELIQSASELGPGLPVMNGNGLTNMRPVLSQPMFAEPNQQPSDGNMSQMASFQQFGQIPQIQQIIPQIAQISTMSQRQVSQLSGNLASPLNISIHPQQLTSNLAMKQMINNGMAMMQPSPQFGNASPQVPPPKQSQPVLDSSMSADTSHAMHQRRSSQIPLQSNGAKTKFPPPPNLEKSLSGTDGIDSFLKNFKS
ncbi:hypothetical protein TRFO_04912 [Tritrichomonas foetus]|uniref:Myb-like DNA-binding domain containing protein n=1 Tax=Tritrichomonas foetus TaxID=1144522 RepID=A0A1J4KAP1_9EUKA|nr:hypothetical protein TRFO_04912 [Tritrichomonas foetus]|eukprot:OHT08299.1 hypothetical protein TRFO_04912 [Tritrichomonas foetus]